MKSKQTYSANFSTTLNSGNYLKDSENKCIFNIALKTAADEVFLISSSTMVSSKSTVSKQVLFIEIIVYSNMYTFIPF